MPPLLRVSGLSKAYAAPVLKRVDLGVAAGEVVALTGENGAGKSTLSKIIAGLTPADAGEMLLDGHSYAPSSRTHAERVGVRMVLQELSLIGTLSIAENLHLGAMPARGGFIRRGELNTAARSQLARIGLSSLDPEMPVSELGIGQQQLVEIARGLMGNARLLILDEPTAMLTTPEIAHLFEQIVRLKAQGVGIIYISHRLDEIGRITDRVVVLRDGEGVANQPTAQFSHDDIVRAMLGDKHATVTQRTRRPAGEEILKVTGLSRGTAVSRVELSLRAGEITGLAGLVGSGRTELLRLIFGADRPDAGEVRINGAVVQVDSPMQAVAHGMGLLTEDRKSQELLPGQNLTTNLTIADLSAFARRGWIDTAKERGAFARWTEKLRIRANSASQLIEQLSGGNQQKVLLARWLERDCRILLLDEPTRGVDVGARADIYSQLDALAAAGKALLVVSSDLRELMELCDRIAVMSAGSLVKTFERGEWTEEALLNAAFSAHAGQRSGGQLSAA
jgi:ribose transport system ATP-binding protein